MKKVSRRSFIHDIGMGIGASATLLALPSFITNPLLNKKADPGKKLNVALCGLGNYATYHLAPGIIDSKYCRLAGIITGSEIKAKEWSTKYNIPDKNIYNYNNFDTISSNKDIDLVYVVLPNSMHKEFVIRSANAGKHVITEKPMAISAMDCEEMIAACKKAGVQLAVGYRLHYDPYNLEIKRFGQQKIFGQVRLIESSFGFKIGDPSQWRLKKKMAGGGPLMDVGIYCVNSTRYVLGEEPSSVTAEFGPISDPLLFSEVEESIRWQFDFPGGAISNSTSTYKANIERFYAAADNGFFEMSPAFSYSAYKGRSSKGEMYFAPINQQAAQMDGIAKIILEKKNLPVHITGEEGLKDIRIMNAIYEAASTGKKVYLK